VKQSESTGFGFHPNPNLHCSPGYMPSRCCHYSRRETLGVAVASLRALGTQQHCRGETGKRSGKTAVR